MPDKREQDDDRDRHAKQPKKDAAAHFLVLHFRVIEPAAVSLVQEDVAREKNPAASPITSF